MVELNSRIKRGLEEQQRAAQESADLRQEATLLRRQAADAAALAEQRAHEKALAEEDWGRRVGGRDRELALVVRDLEAKLAAADERGQYIHTKFALVASMSGQPCATSDTDVHTLRTHQTTQRALEFPHLQLERFHVSWQTLRLSWRRPMCCGNVVWMRRKATGAGGWPTQTLAVESALTHCCEMPRPSW